MATNLVSEIDLMLKEYVHEVQEAVDDAAKEAAETTARQLHANSPKRAKGKGKGSYARGWKVKKRNQGNLVSYVVYNGKNPGLTHVLEKGHVARNQYGSFGRVRAIPHIGPAAEAGIQRFELAVKARLRRL